MAHYQQTTFCEVTYDSDWLSFEDEDDRHITPYRCSLMRNDPDSNSDTGHYAPPVDHIGQQGRATTWHAFNKDNTSELSRAVESEPTRIRPTYPFPSLHLLQGCDSGDELDEAYVYTDRTKKKLLWVDALNKWIPQKKLHPPPYLSFVGNPPVVEKEVNLGQSRENIEKREAIRKRAQELAEQRRQQRKVRITLRSHLSVLRLCSILTNRIVESAIEHHMNRAQVQSSRSHSSLPVSPIHRKEKVPSPKQVWQAEEGPKLQTIHEPKPEPVKREISITLMSPQPEELHINRGQVESSLSHSSLPISPIHREEQVPSPEQVWQAEECPELQTIHEPEPAKREISITLMSPQPEELHMNSAQVQSSRSHSSLPVSPIHREEKVPSPKQVWQAEEDPKLQTIHKPKPKPAKRKISITLMSPQPEEEKLQITKPSEVEPIVIEEVKKPQSPAEETKEIRKSVVEVVKKERRDLRKPTLPQPNFTTKKRELRSFEADTRSEKQDKEKVTSTPSGSLPSLLGTLNPELIEKETSDQKEQQRRNTLSKLISGDKAAKKLRKPGQRDNSYSDELELEEERRKKQMEMYEKLKNRKQQSVYGDLDDGSPRFDDYGFLSKYCIFNKGNIEMYRHAFDVVDDNGVGWLEGEDVMIALWLVNNKLTVAEEEYLYRVLELTGFKITHGADFKMFSVLAALSQRISALDHWMKNLIGQMDFKALEMKMFKCKTLWECNVDKETNSISIDQLCVELRAGGVSWEHEMEVREKLSHLHALDLLDFLTYVPLFIMIHESVVQNPLEDTCNK